MHDNSEGPRRGSAAARYAAVAASLLALGALAVIWRWLRREDDSRPEPEELRDAPAASTTPDPAAAAPEPVAPPGREPVAPDQEPVTPPEQQAVGPYGPDSAEPPPDGSAPDGFTVKGNADSMLYHTPESPYYKRTNPEVWFRSAAAAEAAGFSHWGSRRRRS